MNKASLKEICLPKEERFLLQQSLQKTSQLNIINIRPATYLDISGINSLTSGLIKQGYLVYRSEDDIRQIIEKFEIVELNKSVIGCAGLDIYKEDRCGELFCLAVRSDFRGKNIGSYLLNRAIKKLKIQQCKSIFALTKKTSDWFIKQGFVLVPCTLLPPEKRIIYDYKRMSYVFQKKITN